MKSSRRMQPWDRIGQVGPIELSTESQRSKPVELSPQLPVEVQKSRTVTQDYLTAPLHACLVEGKDISP